MDARDGHAPPGGQRPWLRPGYLLALLLLAFVLIPAVQSLAGGREAGEQRVLDSALKYGVIAVLLLAAVSVAQAKRPWMVIALLAGVPTLLELPSTLHRHGVEGLTQIPQTTMDALDAASGVYVALALMYVVWRGLQRLFTRGRVTLDTIAVAVCAYILLGFAWLWLFNSAELIDNDAFGRSAPRDPSELFYFSFVTLTTLGYGDITPKGSVVRSLAIVEAIIGQMYVAIVLARLVSSFISDRSDKDGDTATDAELPE